MYSNIQTTCNVYNNIQKKRNMYSVRILNSELLRLVEPKCSLYLRYEILQHVKLYMKNAKLNMKNMMTDVSYS